MTLRAMTLGLMIVCGLLTGAGAESPSVDSIVERTLEAAGGEAAFQRLGVLEMAVREEETMSEGKRESGSFTAYAYPPQLDTLRMEPSPRVVVACNQGEGWATMGGELDTRRQTPRMAVGTIHQKLFPLLLPFSLAMKGVHVTDVVAATFDGEDVWQLNVKFEPMFFIGPVMNTDWLLTVRKEDHALLAAEFVPPVEYRKVQNEGVRYRYLKHADIDGVRLPTQVLLDGINFDGIENGHVRVTKVAVSVRGEYDSDLFVAPKAPQKGDPARAPKQ